MGILKLKYTEKLHKDGVTYYCLPHSKFDKFNSSILDLGDISKEGEYFEALAAIFDLEEFTSFSNQIDPHLVIPEFLNEFFDWLFQSITEEFVREKRDEDVVLWCHLPFYAKFMGDGVLFLWDTRTLTPRFIGNIVVSLLNICREYGDVFLPNIRKKFSKTPLRLRCGIARGQIISIGAGKDFVGPCINVASRLQKIDPFSFAFSKRGFSLEKFFGREAQEAFILIKSQIRGIGDEELLFVQQAEFKALSAKERKRLLP